MALKIKGQTVIDDDRGLGDISQIGIGTTANPTGAKLLVDVGTGVTAVTVQGSEGQLFSVTNELTTGSIFSVNDISGIPSIDVDADGTILVAPYSTTEKVGIGTTSPAYKMDVVGDINFTGTLFQNGTEYISGIASLTNDTSPVLGADLDANSNNIFGVNNLNITGVSTFQGNVNLGDNDSLSLGDSSDLVLFHNGSHSFVDDNGVGSLYLRSGVGGVFITKTTGDVMGGFNPDGSVELYHNAVKKFETRTDGIAVSGIVTAISGIVTYYGDGSNLTGVQVTPQGTDTAIQFNANSSFSGIASLASISTSTFSVGIGTIIDIKPYDTQNSGTLSFEASAGQLFSITNNLTTGSIFSVNDVSGIPSIDVDADGTVLVAPYSTTEKVGIGTTNPQYKLHVIGNTNIDGTFTVNGSPVSGGGISSVFDDTTPRLGGNLDGNSKNITGVSSIGIGINNPDGVLDVLFNTSAGNRHFFIPESQGPRLQRSGDTIDWAMDYGFESNNGTNVGGFGAHGSNTGLYKYYIGSSYQDTKFVIESGGDVGIGTDNPSYKLHVVGDLNFTGTLYQNGTVFTSGGGSSLWTSTGYTGIGTSSAVGIGTKIEIVPYDDQDGGTLSFEGSAGNLLSITNNLSSGSIFAVNDISGSPSIDVNADGTVLVAPYSTTEKVGIGTDNPTSKLHVVGDMRVTGIATFGTSSTTIDGNQNIINVGTALTLGHTQGLQFHTQNLHSSGFEVNNINVSGVSTVTNILEVRSNDGTQGRVDFYCESNNAHYTRLQAAAHSEYSGNATVTLPASSGTLLLSDGSGANLTGIVTSGFKTIAVSGQSDVVADAAADTLTLVAGSNITITTDDATDAITFAASSGGAQEAFKTIAVSGQSDVVADAAADTLTLVAGSNMTITTDANGDSITFASSGGGGGSSTLSGLTDVTISGASTGQVLKYNGSAWVNDTDATGSGGGGSGTVDLLEVMLFSS